MVPKPAAPNVPFGLLNCGVLVRLKASARNSTRRPPSGLNGNALNRRAVELFCSGTVQDVAARVSEALSPGVANASVSNQR